MLVLLNSFNNTLGSAPQLAQALAKSLEYTSPVEAGQLIQAATRLSLPITAETEPLLLQNITSQLLKLEKKEQQQFADQYLRSGQGWFSVKILMELSKFLPKE